MLDAAAPRLRRRTLVVELSDFLGPGGSRPGIVDDATERSAVNVAVVTTYLRIGVGGVAEILERAKTPGTRSMLVLTDEA